MSWLYSQALVEEYSPENCLDGEPFAQLNVMPTQQQFWRNDKMIKSSRLSQFGPTLKLLTVDHGLAFGQHHLVELFPRDATIVVHISLLWKHQRTAVSTEVAMPAPTCTVVSVLPALH